MVFVLCIVAEMFISNFGNTSSFEAFEECCTGNLNLNYLELVPRLLS